MNKEKFQKGIMDIKKIGLTSAEKFQLKSSLDFYIETNTQNIPVKSSWYNSYHFAFTKLYATSFAVVLILVVSGGTYFNAENALPGDTLYSLKVSVIEPLKYSAAVSEVDKANLEVAHLDARLREAEALEVKGKLTDAISNDLQSRINTHTEAFNKIVEDLSNDNKLEEDSDLEIDYQAKMNAHARVIDSIKNSDNNDNINKIKIAIQRTSNKSKETAVPTTVASAKMMTFSVVAEDPLISQATTSKIGTTTSTTTDSVFIKRKKDTQNIINIVRKNIEKSKKNLKASQKILDDAEGLVNEAEKSLNVAEEQIRGGDRDGAKQFLINSRIRAKEAVNSLELSQDLPKE